MRKDTPTITFFIHPHFHISSDAHLHNIYIREHLTCVGLFRMIVINIANQKGGIGKTAIAFNLAHILATRRSEKILAIDNDPQGNLKPSFLNNPAELTSNILEEYNSKRLSAGFISRSDRISLIKSLAWSLRGNAIRSSGNGMPLNAVIEDALESYFRELTPSEKRTGLGLSFRTRI